MLEFSFIDHGLKDFIRNDENKVLIKEFRSWEDADEFVMDGRLDEFGWTNEGTTKVCWNDDEE
jgi:hypothetical protein